LRSCGVVGRRPARTQNRGAEPKRVASGLVPSALGVSPGAASSPARSTNRHSVNSGPSIALDELLGLAYTEFVYAIVVVEAFTPLSLRPVKMSSIAEMFGVRIDASNSFVQAAIYGFLVVGIAAFAAPVVSTVRVLLSLFVLPGKSVRASTTLTARP
jgi:hypothetical protein